MEEYVVNRNKVYLGILAHEFTTLSLSISTDPDIIEKYGDYAFVS